ncbi:MAG: InlB B-repeat-containing protein [Paludibacteraceae bacterium]|nr:InlB B-repeat-containing protein [Paludibacteraceae bacterium]
MRNSFTKSVTLFTLLLTLGVSSVWAGNRRIYFDYSAVSWWKDYTNLNSGAGFAKVHCWGGNTGDQDYTLSAVDGQTDLAYCDIDDGWTNICFFRCGSDGTWWTKTYNYDNFGSKNYFKIKDDHDTDGGLDRYKWDSATRWNPGVCIDGLIDVNNPHNQAFSFTGNDGTYSATLSAHSTYQFCIRDGSTRYTLDNHVWTSNISNYTLNQSTSDYDIRMTTAGAGTYTFTYNKSTHIISVTYPTVSHPNIDYCYMIGYDNWTHKYLNIWNSASSIAGTTYPGTEMYNYFTIGETKYYYFAYGDYAKCQPNDNIDIRKTDEMNTSDGHGKYISYIDGWGWRDFIVRIQLNDLSATTAVVPTYQDVAFNSAVLTDLTSVPAKTHYDFGGFYTGYDSENDIATGTQVIDASGHWIASVADYTDADKHWIHPGTSTTLYALWTEHEYSLTINVEPAGAGTVSPSPTTVKYVTPTALLTATPSTDAYIFKEWRYSTNLGPVSGTGLDNTVQVTASQNGTLTAVFEPRFTLVGSIYNDSGYGGMPGWSDYTAVFTINTVSPLNATCTRKLDPNTTFKFEVHDKTGSGRNLGHYSPAGPYIGNNSWECNTQNSDIYLRATGHGDYTFTISAVREDNGNYYPTISVSGPSSHLMNLGWGHAEIDNPSSVTDGENTGGTVSAQTTESGDHYAIVNGQYVADGGTITYTPNAATGYSFDGWYSSNAYSGNPFSRNNPWAHENVTSDDNVYAKFTEKSTSVTLANDGHGHVTIGGTTVANTTCGVTTHRELTAVPSDGYMFSSWTKTSGDDITISSTSTNPITLTGNGDGASSGQTVTANFTQRWVLKAESEGWGSETFTISNISEVSGDAVGYVDIDLAANTNYQFTMKDLSNNNIYKNNNVEVQYMTYTNHTDWGFATNMTYNCGITTAGKGTYRFSWNITDKTMTVTYPTSYQVNYGASVGGSVTSVVDGQGNAVPNGGYVVAGGSVTYTAAANNANYTFVGWCNNDSYGEPFTNYNPWTNSNVQATSNAYAKFKSTNFVIYRTGDMSSDPRRAYDDVESFAGGAVSETIEFRMKVSRLDQWYTLCLPFEVNNVQVWDEDDQEYYDIKPYYRASMSDPLSGGHYIIRTPSGTTDFPIANFDDWKDPTSQTGYLPTKGAPYIIQWHMDYFRNRYVSFFGNAQTIASDFNAGADASIDNAVNVYGNNTMHTGSVTGAYLLDPDYGSSGAWLRDENVSANRTILPFECFIRANSATRAKYRVIRPDMEIEDINTGGLPVTDKTLSITRKIIINNQLYIIREGRIYTVQGTLVKEVE